MATKRKPLPRYAAEKIDDAAMDVSCARGWLRKLLDGTKELTTAVYAGKALDDVNQAIKHLDEARSVGKEK